MHVPHSTKFGKKVKIIQPGEYHVSSEDEMIGTMLGSCVSVCLYDPVVKVSGMNHFMLPGRIVQSDMFNDKSARYGVTAITELLMLMEKHGAERKNIRAKVFGGGNVIPAMRGTNSIPFDNVRLACLMLEIEDIPIDEMAVGGSNARKIIMEVATGTVFMKTITRSDVIEKIKDQESSYVRGRLDVA
ncbi:MAG: chemotaxis protein CheD [Spirochaetes bacterium]|nr:chemotaxis protein CheD [Spirochaetota bacterium]